MFNDESLAYVVKGKKMTVGQEEYILVPGDVAAIRLVVPHGVEGIENRWSSRSVPAPDISSFLGM